MSADSTKELSRLILSVLSRRQHIPSRLPLLDVCRTPATPSLNPPHTLPHQPTLPYAYKQEKNTPSRTELIRVCKRRARIKCRRGVSATKHGNMSSLTQSHLDHRNLIGSNYSYPFHLSNFCPHTEYIIKKRETESSRGPCLISSMPRPAQSAAWGGGWLCVCVCVHVMSVNSRLFAPPHSV